MEQIKQRDYRLDIFRCVLIWCILVSHFTRVAGHYQTAFLGQVIYTTFMIFGMEGFVFLSGYFSKKPERARETAFHTLLWPYIVCIPFFFMIRDLIMGNAHLDLTIPPFALWYLFVLFIYRFFLKNYIKIPHIFEISFIIFLTAGLVPFFNDKFALGRMLSFFPFFLMGYYCTEEHLEKIRSLRKWQCGILAVILVGLSVAIVKFATQYPTAFILLKSPHNELGLTWYWDIIGRLGIFIIATGWIILLLNIIPNRKNYLVYIGKNTMPIYILHIIIRYLVKKHGITFEILPDNRVLYYVLIFVLATLCVVVFSSPPVVKLYNLIIEGLYKLFMLILKAIVYVMGLIHIPLAKIANGGMNTIYRIGGKAKALADDGDEKDDSDVSEDEPPALTEEEQAEKAAAEDAAYNPAMWFKEKEETPEDEAEEQSDSEEQPETEASASEEAPAYDNEPEAGENESVSEHDNVSDEDTEDEPIKGEPEMTEEEKALEAEKKAYLASIFEKDSSSVYAPEETDEKEKDAENTEAEQPADEAADTQDADVPVDEEQNESTDAEAEAEEADAAEEAAEDEAEDAEEAEDTEPEMTEEEKATALEAEKEAFLASLFGKESIPHYEPKESDIAESEAEEAEAAEADETEEAEEEAAAPEQSEDAAAEESAEEGEESDDSEAQDEEDDYSDDEDAEYEDDDEPADEGNKGFKDKILSKFKTDRFKSRKSRSRKSETAYDGPAEPARLPEPEEKVLEFAVYGMTQEEVEAIMNIKREEEAPAENDVPEEAPEAAETTETTETTEE